MTKLARLALVVGCAWLLVVGCSSQPDPGAQSSPSPETESEVDAPTAEPLADESSADAPASEAPDSPVSAVPDEPASAVNEPSPTAVPVEQPPEETPAPAQATVPAQTPEPSVPAVADPIPAPAPSPPTSPPPPAPAVPNVVDVGGPVAVEATKPGLTRIGAGKCKICHKVQFASWSETAHATRTPPLDCEDCHGPGSEYKSKKVMEDPELALAAGLVRPDRSFCSRCHKAGWTDDQLERAHAHKVDDS